MTRPPTAASTRREFLRHAAGLVVLPILGRVNRAYPQEAEPFADSQLGTLRDPGAAGRPRAPTSDADNDAVIRAIELRLKCPCPCTLDVFTCRTTDFTCTYSPARHREVVALYEQGSSPQEILDTFVAKYGEQALMAPRPEGFNLAGYLVPGAAITVVGGALAWVLGRRVRAERGNGGTGEGIVPDRDDTSVVPTHSAVPPFRRSASAAELERLRHALSEIDD